MATIQEVYIALFGRPADPIGYNFYVEATDDGANLDAVGDLSNSPEYLERFEGMSNIQKVNQIYNDLFGRDADAAGLTFYVGLLNSGAATEQSIAIQILDGATGDDATIIENKVAAAQLFTDSLDEGDEIAAYDGAEAAEAGRAFLNGVDETEASIPDQAAVDAAIDAIVEGNFGTPGDLFTLTAQVANVSSGVDELDGTNGDDTFRAITADSLETTDILDGRAGYDVLNISEDAMDGDVAPVISGIERINNDDTDELDLADVTGVEEIWSSNDGDYINAALGTFFGAENLEAGTTVSVEYEDAAGTANLAVNNSDEDGDVAFDFGAGAEDLTGINLLVAAGNSADATVTLDADSDAVETVTVSGEGDLDLDVAAGTLTSIVTFDAEAATGDVTVDLSGAAELETVTMGSGDDTLDLDGTESGVVVTAGEGNDVIDLAAIDNIDDASEDEFEADILEISDFDTAEDFLDVSASAYTEVTITTTQNGEIQDAESLFDAVTYVAENVADDAGELAIFGYGGDTYLFVQGTSAVAGPPIVPAGFGDDDGLVKLTGVAVADLDLGVNYDS